MNDELKETNFNLFLASYNGDLEQIKLYASLKGNINFALAGAVHGSHLELVTYLLNNGATDVSGSLHYARDIKTAWYLSRHSDFFSNTKFIKKIFSENVTKFFPFSCNENYEISIDNIQMRKHTEYLYDIIIRSDEDVLVNYSHECKKYDLMIILLSIKKNLDMFFLDNENFLDYVKKLENVPNFITIAEKYLKNTKISIKKIVKLNEYSPLSSRLARYYIRHNTEHAASGRKKYRLSKAYKKYIKYDPVFIIFAASYNEENKLLYSVPTDIFITINLYF
jgi:hypothetical protein